MESLEKLNHYDGSEVLERFNIKKNMTCLTLKEWLTVQGTLTEVERSILEDVRFDLEKDGRYWNEEELKINFIAFVFYLAKINVEDKIKVFYERSIKGTVDNISISVKVDAMVASPTNANRPKVPYFFLQEFKRSLGDDHDPEGQMLAAMILSQELNQDDRPIFGCWLQGKFWNFTTLIGRDYCVSKTYDATDIEDLYQIVFILRKLKELILNR